MGPRRAPAPGRRTLSIGLITDWIHPRSDKYAAGKGQLESGGMVEVEVLDPASAPPAASATAARA